MDFGPEKLLRWSEIMTDNEPGQTPENRRGESSSARNHRRTAARQKAQLARRKQKARARRGRWAIIAGVAVVIIALVVGATIAIRGSVPEAGKTPANMVGDGILIGKGFKAVSGEATPQSSSSASSAPQSSSSATSTSTPTSTAPAADTVTISIYLDYLCPVCGEFEKANNDYIKGLVESGAATVEYHPIAILTNTSLGSKYSQRAAAAAACVANYSPDAYFDFNTAMFDRQPDEQTTGLSNAQLISLIKGVSGITNTSQISKCVNDQTYASWAVSATQRALAGPLDGTAVPKITSTPTVLVNGQQYQNISPFTPEDFSNFVVTAAGNSYTDTATSSPSPTPSPTPTKTSTPTKKK